jgi:serine phosphatase RsbU (regulator of sigma subunit)
MADDIYAAVRAHTGDVPQQDDVTLLILHRDEGS